MNREQAFRFGRAEHLVGIAGLPTQSRADVGVIILNSGMVHRVGPFRLHVELARELNALGYPTLRFDLSTLGDSQSDPRSRSRAEQVRGDVGDAMKLLATHAGCSRFVLLGLCLGARNAHTAAVTEAGVAGAVFLDGYIYRSRGFLVRHYLPRLFSPVRWWRFMRRSMRRRPNGDEVGFEDAYPPRTQVRDELAAMLARDLQMYFIFSGGIGEQFNHIRQFRECYGALAAHPGVCVDMLHGTDHTYTLHVDRRRMFDAVRAWMTQRFPVDTTGPAS